MATTFLAFVNDALKRVHVIQGDAGVLATSTVTSTATGLTATGAFVDSARQVQIDLMIQCANETFQEMFRSGLIPKVAATATFTWVSAQREYSLPSDFEGVAGETYRERALRGATNGLVIYEYPGGYARMLVDQPRATDFVGSPGGWAISPVNDTIRLDCEPATGNNGETWNLLYNRTIRFTSTSEADALPCSAQTCDSLIPVVADHWNRAMKGIADPQELRKALGRAIANAMRVQARDSYGPARR